MNRVERRNPASDRRPASTERLDRSQESIDLKQAVWAGFIKSRFWRIARWFKPHAVVGTFILLATPLLYRSIVLEEITTQYVLFATIGLLSVWYVVHPNLELLGRLWEHPWGKLFYALVASLATGSAETLRVFRYRANRRQYLCRAIFQYRSAADGGRRGWFA